MERDVLVRNNLFALGEDRMNRLVGTLLVWAVMVGAMAQGAKPIPNVKATATSEQVKGLFSAQNLCNDHGLSDAGRGDGSQKLTTNGYAGGGMWHSGYIALGGDENPIVQFDLGKVFRVGRFRVWNHNGNPSRGFRQVSVLISDDAKTWKPQSQRFTFARAPREDTYLGEEYEFKPVVRARYIRFVCESTHRTGGHRELAGLGKVRFYEAAAGAATAEDRGGAGVFPDAAGVVNVRLAPYLARGDGSTDDTAALQRAIDDHQGSRRTILLPEGTYLVSKPLRYKPARGHGYNNLRGAGRDRTTIRLKDGMLVDGKQPRPVLALAYNGREDGKGVHADWFNNNVSELTIHTGQGNPGAIGLQFFSNNVGSLRDVRIQSGDGQGVIGLDLGYADQNGPCFIKGVFIDGFATGVKTSGMVNSQTLEQITIENASQVGWENVGQCLSIRKLKVTSSGPGMINRFGVVALIDSDLTGTKAARDLSAIVTHETLFARNVRTEGYKLAITNNRKKDKPTPNAEGPTVEEWVSTAPLSLFPTGKPRSLNLPIRETPDVPADDPTTWVNVRSFRELADPDDTASVQRAIDSGARTIYFPAGGHFYFSKPVELRGSVRRVVGMFAGVHGIKGQPAAWKVADKGPPIVIVQDLIGELAIEHTSKRTLVVKNGQGIGGTLSGGGDLFLENVVADWTFATGRAWARQFNNERLGTHITNSGTTLWILGLKTERGGTLIQTNAGASTELIGGLSYTTNKGKLAPMFVSTDAQVSYMIGEVCYTRDPYTRLVEERRGSETKTLSRGSAPLRAAFLQGSELPLYVGKPMRTAP
jgi:hypothetical protein